VEALELSIIIPVYNAQRYLEECLESVLACSMKEMECIIINDGSKDNSYAICQYYVEKDSRFQLINKENGGVSAARNTGIEVATGKFLMFLDADDYMDKQAWIEIRNCIENENYEFVAFSYYTLFKNGTIKEEPYSLEDRISTDMSRIRSLLMASSSLNTCWGKLFLLDKIRSYKIRFNPDLVIGEDFIFVADYFKRCSSAMIKNIPVLYYRQHSASAMVNNSLDTRLQYTDILFHYNKASVLEYRDEKLMKDMYVHYLRIITKLFLVFAKNYHIFKLKGQYKLVLHREVITEIIGTVELSQLPLQKKIEGVLLKKNCYLLLAGYFKLKSCFLQ
jgi:glycosyltransferase involved in cell wall biosynthesis